MMGLTFAFEMVRGGVCVSTQIGSGCAMKVFDKHLIGRKVKCGRQWPVSALDEDRSICL